MFRKNGERIVTCRIDKGTAIKITFTTVTFCNKNIGALIKSFNQLLIIRVNISQVTKHLPNKLFRTWLRFHKFIEGSE